MNKRHDMMVCVLAKPRCYIDICEFLAQIDYDM